MGNALARELGLEPVVFKVAFDGLILAVQGGRVDLINSGSYISAARQEPRLVAMVHTKGRGVPCPASWISLRRLAGCSRVWASTRAGRRPNRICVSHLNRATPPPHGADLATS
ncbi:transporter substrate-binding domain-containing protein [Mesorhizobium sp.]|uniref:transporter substrate-binding domain-containing protein n=1 Tax=Mesorhizobium sp. TaxID=1871066 RepID=UPI000FE4DD3D|nr:MAG: transporter substrate-binding domain-containing protein [Mesorhizobium sp.]RWM58304.1 MAG: transporter substrate-binding domain-containing protein [Mesorhizobium sp.]RWM58902.1 MAG: transporter substrate-binding domain-containing protein [Mesorhizobium sp.]TIO70168.1 MAG: transporter substrate-binding domain-containing protein [Mesorhizobium sp.]TJV94033.1 MAG: transporter substrate-binding domain-containing protein [Mesorhizobium sp.]